MKIPIVVYATRPVAPILFTHVLLAVVIPTAAAVVAYLLTLAITCN